MAAIRLLKLTETPPAWADEFHKARVFAWDDTKKAWEDSPIAVTGRVIWGKVKSSGSKT